MKEGISTADTFNKIDHFIDENQGKSIKTFKHEDGTMRDNKVHKEQLKFIAAYEVAIRLTNEFKEIKTIYSRSYRYSHQNIHNLDERS